jgi:hypothetical protein
MVIESRYKMENKNTGLKVTVVILCLIVLGLSGYIVYDKVLSKEENVQDTIDDKNNNENRDEQDISDNEEIDKNNSKNDSFYETILNNIENNLIDFYLKQSLKQDKINYGKINFEYDCIEENEYGDCLDGNLTINNQTYYVNPTAEVFYNTEYLIIKDDGGDGYYGDFTVVDFTGRKIISKEHVGTICNVGAIGNIGNGCDYFGVKGNSEKIYYIERDKNNKLYLKRINLVNNLEIEVVSELNDYVIAG